MLKKFIPSMLEKLQKVNTREHRFSRRSQCASCDSTTEFQQYLVFCYLCEKPIPTYTKLKFWGIGLVPFNFLLFFYKQVNKANHSVSELLRCKFWVLRWIMGYLALPFDNWALLFIAVVLTGINTSSIKYRFNSSFLVHNAYV